MGYNIAPMGACIGRYMCRLSHVVVSVFRSSPFVLDLLYAVVCAIKCLSLTSQVERRGFLLHP